MKFNKLLPLSLVILLSSCSLPAPVRTHDKVDWDNTFNEYGLFKDANFWLYTVVTLKYASKDRRLERKVYVDNNKCKVNHTEFGLERFCYFEVHYDDYKESDNTYLVDFYQEDDYGWTKETSYRSLDIYYIYGDFIPTHYEDFVYDENAGEFKLIKETTTTVSGDLITINEGRVTFENHRLTEYSLNVDVTSGDLTLHKTIKAYPLDFGYQKVELPKV